jgi:acyl-CoA synthetase (NDP forming)
MSAARTVSRVKPIVVLKAGSSEVDGIRLDLRPDTDVRTAFTGILKFARSYKPRARIEGVTMQPFFSNPDFKILLDTRRDANFGPVHPDRLRSGDRHGGLWRRFRRRTITGQKARISDKPTPWG